MRWMFVLLFGLALAVGGTAISVDTSVEGSETQIAPAVQQPAAPAVQQPAAPAVQQPAAPAVQQPAAPAAQQPAAPAAQQPAAPAAQQSAAPAAQNGSQSKPKKEFNSIIFEGAARFACARGGAPAFLNGRPTLYIYPDMTLKFDADGNYFLAFEADSPRTDVVLTLTIEIPYKRGVGSDPLENQLNMTPNDPGAAIPKVGLTDDLAIVEFRPIRLGADQGEAASSTLQHFKFKRWVTGRSTALAQVFGCCGSQTVRIPAGGITHRSHLVDPFAIKRYGSALVGTVVK